MGVDASPDLDNSPANIATLRTIWNHQQHSAEWRFSGDFDNGLFGLGDGLNLLLGVFYMNPHFRQSTQASAGRDIDAYLTTGDANRQPSGSTTKLALPGLGALGHLARHSVQKGKCVYGRVEHGGSRQIKKKTK